jgi:hypothetical protein
VVPVDPEHLKSASTPIPVAAGPNLADRIEHSGTAVELWLMPRQHSSFRSTAENLAS